MQLDLKQVFQQEGFILPIDLTLDLSDEEVYGLKPFADPVKISGSVENHGRVVMLKYRAEARYTRECDRCLEITSQPLTFTFEHIVSPVEPEDDGSEDGTDGIPASSMSEEAFDWWAGGWYGWWMVFDGDGLYADLINEAWDCCAYIEPFIGSDSGVDEFLISIWDEDYNDYYENCISEAVLQFSPTAGGGDLGAMVSTDKGGYFWAGEVAQGDWLIDPDYAGYDNMIIIEGNYVDEDGEYLEYGIVLTKWGQEWNPDATYEPDYYYDYFLPLIEDGAEIPLTLEP